MLLAVVNVFAQEHNYTQYTVEDGLPTNYVYGVVEDDRGYIWAYTEQGIARFDGYEWKTFGLNEGLETLDCFSMCPLADGSFLVGGQGWPAVVKNDSLFKLPITGYLDSSILESSFLFEGYPPILQNIKKDENKSRHNVVLLPDSNEVYYNVIKEVFRGFQGSVFPSDERKIELQDLVETKDLLSSESKVYLGKYGRDEFLFWGSPDHYWLNDEIIGAKDSSRELSFRGVMLDDQFQAFVDSAVFVYDESFRKISFKKDLSSWYQFLDVNRVFRAKNGDLWIATRSNGVVKIREMCQQVRVVSDVRSASVSIEGVRSIGGDVYFADDNSQLFLYSGGLVRSLGLEEYEPMNSRFQYLRETRADELILKRRDKIFSIHPGHVDVVGVLDGASVAGKEAIMMFYRNEIGDFTTNLLNYPDKGHKGSILGSNFKLIIFPKYIMTLGFDGTYKFANTESKVVYEREDVSTKDRVIVADKGTLMRISSGRIDTLCRFDSLSITAIHSLSENSILIGTQANGVYQLSLNHARRLIKLFDSKSVLGIIKSPKGKFWASTYSGVYRFTLDGEIEVHLSQLNGLPSSETYDLDFFADSVAVGTAKGLAIFSQEIEFGDGEQLPDRFVTLKEFRARGEQVATDMSSVSLSPEQNDIEIDFSLLHPGSDGIISYEVQLSPLDREPFLQSNRSVRYSQLKAGNYTFTVLAKALDGSSYTLQHPLEIHIQGYVYKQLWFQLLCLLLICGASWLYYRARVKDKYRIASERINNDRRISELQLEALRSQMNPHFVFNALGSIQYYIQTEEKKLADSYLTKFAQLMRKYLDNSKKSFVTVGEEVALLTQYMDLEKMRFDQGFVYRINVDDEIDDSDLIPSMILQPFVENAIIHGIANRNSPGGEIDISIWIENNETNIAITDNGIGVENSNKLKRRGHRSRATEITNERINALRNAGNVHIELIYEVPYPGDTIHPGTRAILRINYHHDED